MLFLCRQKTLLISIDQLEIRTPWMSNLRNEQVRKIGDDNTLWEMQSGGGRNLFQWLSIYIISYMLTRILFPKYQYLLLNVKQENHCLALEQNTCDTDAKLSITNSLTSPSPSHLYPYSYYSKCLLQLQSVYLYGWTATMYICYCARNQQPTVC